MIHLYYGIICNVLSLVCLLQVIEMKFKLVWTRKDINCHMYPRRSRDGLASCMTTCRALNNVIWRTSVFSVSWLYFLCVDFIPRQLFLSYSQWWFVFSQLNNPVEKHFFPSSNSKSTGLIGLSHLPISEAFAMARGMEFLGCLCPNYVPIPGAQWWSQLELHELKGVGGWEQGFPKGNWTADIRMRKNGFWAGESNRSPLMHL